MIIHKAELMPFDSKLQMFGRLWDKIFSQAKTKPKDGFARLSYFDQELTPLLARRVAELEFDLLSAQKEIKELKATQGNYSTGDKMTELTMHGQYESSRTSRLGDDVGMKQAFGDSKAMVSLFGTLDFNEYLYGTAAFLYSGDGVLYSSTSVSGSLYYKLGEQKNWVLGGGGGRTAYADSASEQFATIDVIYYTGPWLVVQSGARHVHSEPSQKSFQRFYAALTFFMQQTIFLLRYETGGDAYAVIDDKKQQVFDFHSQVFNATAIAGIYQF